MVATLLALVLAAWLVAMYTMLRMVLAAFMDPEKSIWWLLSPSMPLASYNRKNLRLFATCIFFMVAVVILFNVLFVTGYIKTDDPQIFPRGNDHHQRAATR
jgi:hypothetical protein